MPQSLTNVLIHAVYSTKDREPFLLDRADRDAVHKLIGGISNNQGCPVIAVGGVEDHIHILARLGRTTTIADWIKELKRESTLWIKSEIRDHGAFASQAGYAAFSVAQAHAGEVVDYITHQETHHREVSFQDELRKLLIREGVAFDERSLWD